MVPESLREREAWIVYEMQKRGDYVTKVPSVPWADDTDHTDPENQRTYEEVDEWVKMTLGHYGYGFCFVADGPFVGVDLDDCRDPDTGELDEYARDIIERLDSFSVVSTSGTGVHIYVRGRLDKALKNEDRGVELYDRDRFFAWTGDHISGTPTEVNEAQDALDSLMDEYMVEQDEPPEEGEVPDVPKVTGDDHDLFNLRVTDVYNLPRGANVPHPIHGSSTGANFKIQDDGETAVCWRGEHAYGTGDGCGLNAQHLLAMEFHRLDNCRDVRQRWPDAELVFGAYIEACKRGLIDANPPPWLALQHISDEMGVEGLNDGGKSAWVAYRVCCRLIEARYEIGVEIKDREATSPV